MKKRFLMLLPCTASAVLLCNTSCVNEAYDLSKGINTTIDVNGDISAPIGSTEKILIGDFFKIDGENSMISVDSDGNYSFSVTGDEISGEVDIPEIDLSGLKVPDGVRFSMDLPEIPGGLWIPEYEFEFPVTESATGISVTGSVPEYLTAIGRVTTDGTLYLSLRLTRDDGRNSGEVDIMKGFTIDFPAYLTVSKQDASDSRFTIENGHTIVLAEDVALRIGASVILPVVLDSIDFGNMPEGQGLVGNELIIDDQIELSGLQISARADSFGDSTSDLPSSLILDTEIDISRISVRSAEIMLDPAIDVDDQTVELGEIPDFLTGENTRLDIYPVVSLMVTNDSPLSFTLAADIASVSGEDTTHFELGQDREIVIGSGVTPVYIVRRESDVPEGPVGATNDPVIIVDEKIADLVARVPDKIAISDIEVRTVQEMTVVDLQDAGRAAFSFEYAIDAPLAFGEKLSIEYPYDITGLNKSLNPSEDGTDKSSFQINLTEASVYLNFVNEIPLSLAVTAFPIDTNGEIIGEGLEVSLVSPTDNSPVTVAAGNTGNASTTSAVIRIKASDNEFLRKLDGFRLNLNGGCDSRFAGVALNEAQGIQLTDISVNIRGGVSTQL